MKENSIYQYHKKIKKHNYTHDDFGLGYYFIAPFDCICWNTTKEGYIFWYHLSLQWALGVCYYLLSYKDKDETPLDMFGQKFEPVIGRLYYLLEDFPQKYDSEQPIFETKKKLEVEIGNVKHVFFH